MNKIVDRRDFLKLAGITTVGTAASLGLAGCSQKGKKATETEVGGGINFTKEVDVLIIGSGGAGLWCAFETLNAGLSTCILEKEIAHGGDSLLACACLPILGTKPLIESGLMSMTAEEAYEKYYDPVFSKRRVPELGKYILLNSARCIDIWTEKFGVKWMPFIPGPTVYFHVPVPGLGTDYLLINPLFDDVVKSGADVMFETKAMNFIVNEKNEVVGVRALDLRSQTYVDIRAKAIAVTSGDFVSNQEMVAKNLPEWGRMVCNTYTSMGQGLEMSLPIGATLERMDEPANFTAENPNIVVWGFYDPVLQVLPNGKRFCNESLAHEVAEKCYENGFNEWYGIYDEEIANGYNSYSIENIAKIGLVNKADTIEELALKINIPPEELAKTLVRFNEQMEAGEDQDFGRKSFLRPLKAPFYAAYTRPVRYKTYGGLRVNEKCQMIDASDQPIAHMYAAGSVTGSATPNVPDVCALGMHAGQMIAQELAA
jgi:fumarate reductase flavoprotein subunit